MSASPPFGNQSLGWGFVAKSPAASASIANHVTPSFHMAPATPSAPGDFQPCCSGQPSSTTVRHPGVLQSLVGSTFSFRFMVLVDERHPRLSGLCFWEDGRWKSGWPDRRRGKGGWAMAQSARLCAIRSVWKTFILAGARVRAGGPWIRSRGPVDHGGRVIVSFFDLVSERVESAVAEVSYPFPPISLAARRHAGGFHS